MPTSTDATADRPWVPLYERWRHGGWYVTNVRWPSGAAGCVSRNYADGKWRIVCDPRPFATAPTFGSRDEAAHAEHDLVAQLREVGSCGCRYLPGGLGELVVVSCREHTTEQARDLVRAATEPR